MRKRIPDDPVKAKARSAVLTALRQGRLVRPRSCEDCGQPSPNAIDGTATICAHHFEGYEFPLRVRWLCPKCHYKYDRRPCGEKHGRAKLTWEQVEEIRKRGRKAGVRAMAREYGVWPTSITRILKLRYWASA
jgi:hypothetical protein